ncbi:MAG: UDP-N-acetylmuramoyl-tripeptide--D-alanyl-D-alanine ligase [Arenimonas sp.]
MPLSQIAAWCEGRHLGLDPSIDAVSTDTRTLQPGSLFIALRGENFDAHDMIGEAQARGAAALLLQRDLESDLPRILCADTEEALGEFAAGMQKGRSAVVVGITGSNGKTSVKMLTNGILARTGRTYMNPGNRNNEIGLPLAVLDAPEDAQFAIYEMGAGKSGDIAYLASIAPPQVALVNNIAPAHLERMGSLLGIAETKAAIYEALSDDGVAVINADDAFAPMFADVVGSRRVFRFGVENDAEVHASRIRRHAQGSQFQLHTPAGNALIRLPLPGMHSVMNALAASALALAAGAGFDAVVEGLHGAEPVKGRQIARRLANGAVLIDDSYNANPGSVAAAIATLARGDGEAWLVLGDMAELGEGAAQLHADIGAQAKRAGLARLWTVGQLSGVASQAFGDGGKHFQSQQALIDALHDSVRRHSRPETLSVLVKGSRSSAMDRVFSALLIQAHEDTGHAA